MKVKQLFNKVENLYRKAIEEKFGNLSVCTLIILDLLGSMILTAGRCNKSKKTSAFYVSHQMAKNISEETFHKVPF